MGALISTAHGMDLNFDATCRSWLDKGDFIAYPDNAFDTNASKTDFPDNISSLASDKKARCREWKSGGRILSLFFFWLV